MAGSSDIPSTLAGVVAAVAERLGVDVPFRLAGRRVEPSAKVRNAVLDSAQDDQHIDRWGPWLPGLVLEAMRSPADRRRGGIHHTRPELARAVVEVAFASSAPIDHTTLVADPAVGGGAFLLAAAERLPGSRREVVARLLGCDVDPLAVATAGAALSLWAGGEEPPPDNLVVSDFLIEDPLMAPPDLIVGNPPFLGQLRGSTVRSDADRRHLAARWPGVGRYVDSSAAFLLASIEAVSRRGCVALIQPESFLSALDAAPVRERVESALPLVALWSDDQRHFDAAVDTVAVVCSRPVDVDVDAEVVLWDSVPPRSHGSIGRPDAASWAGLLAAQRGVPPIPSSPAGATLGDVAHVTAGFRDQFYGLRAAVVEEEDGSPRLITSGLIDPLENLWGTRSCRYDRRSWDHPTVMVDQVSPDIADWVAQRLRPKVLVASQTKVIEAAADPTGELVPCTPVITVEPMGEEPSVWLVAALLTCPIASARLAHVAAGSALSPQALRVTASRLASLPLPVDRRSWEDAAEAARQGKVLATGQRMLEAHGLGDRTDLLDWWAERLPNR